jgi:hypothetical protein
VIDFLRCTRTLMALAFLFLTIGGRVSADSSSNSERVATGVLKGEMSLPTGLARPHPFIVAYSAVYGEQVIPVKEHLLTAQFEVRLRPGIYYLFFVLDGYEPTCHVAEILAGEVASYNPKQGQPILIKEYTTSPNKKKIDLQTPLRQTELPTASPLPPR